MDAIDFTRTFLAGGALFGFLVSLASWLYCLLVSRGRSQRDSDPLFLASKVLAKLAAFNTLILAYCAVYFVERWALTPGLGSERPLDVALLAVLGLYGLIIFALTLPGPMAVVIIRRTSEKGPIERKVEKAGAEIHEMRNLVENLTEEQQRVKEELRAELERAGLRQGEAKERQDHDINVSESTERMVKGLEER